MSWTADNRPLSETSPGGPVPWNLDPGLRLILVRLEAAMALTQEQIDAYAGAVGNYSQAVTTAVDGLRNDIQALKGQIGPEVDTTALDARMGELSAATARLAQLDAENPPAPGPGP